jgi:N-glycosylase/DNA lyase
MKSKINKKEVEDLKVIYERKKKEIESQIKTFKNIWINGSDEELFSELAFCILTPQSKAKVCWQTIEELTKTGILFNGSKEEIRKALRIIRFYNNKTMYLTNARDKFLSNGNFSIRKVLSKFDEPRECRDWLVSEVKGIGYKEASHFLRNIGLGEKLAILDRHILKNMRDLYIIEEIPKTLNRKRYLLLESRFSKFSDEIGIPLSHLDLLLWYRETGEIFK